jgi:hypothetical protein
MAENRENIEKIIEIVEAARAWSPTRLTRTGSGERTRLIEAVNAAAGLDVGDVFADEYSRGHETSMADERVVFFG